MLRFQPSVLFNDPVSQLQQHRGGWASRLNMLRYQLLRQNVFSKTAQSVGVNGGFASQLSSKLAQKGRNCNSNTFLTNRRGSNLLQNVSYYAPVDTPLPINPVYGLLGWRMPQSLAIKATNIRTYASRRRLPPSPRATDTPPPLPGPPLPQPLSSDTENQYFNREYEIQHLKEVKYVERGFLAVFVVLYLVCLYSDFSWKKKHQREMQEQCEAYGQGIYRYTISIGDELMASGVLMRRKNEETGGLNEPEMTITSMNKPEMAITSGDLDGDSESVHIKLSPTGLYPFIKQNFTFSPAKIFPISGTEIQVRPWTIFTSSLLHGGVAHGLFCYFSLKVFTPEIIFHYGPTRFVGLFFAGAGLSSTLFAAAQRMLNPAAGMSKEEINRALISEDVDENEKRTLRSYYQNSMGSSGAIIALGGQTLLYHQSKYS